MAKTYLELMNEARKLAARDANTLADKLRDLARHFPDLVSQAVANIGGMVSSGHIDGNGRKAPKAAMAAGPKVMKAAKKRRKLTKVETEELRKLVLSSLKGKTKQTEFVQAFRAKNKGYKLSTVMKIIGDYRKSGQIKSEPVEKGNSKAGIWLTPK